MNEINVDAFDFYSSMNHYSDRLFGHEPIVEVLLLTDDHGIEHEVVMPIAEYRRLKRLIGRRGRKSCRRPAGI